MLNQNSNINLTSESYDTWERSIDDELEKKNDDNHPFYNSVSLGN